MLLCASVITTISAEPSAYTAVLGRCTPALQSPKRLRTQPAEEVGQGTLNSGISQRGSFFLFILSPPDSRGRLVRAPPTVCGSVSQGLRGVSEAGR